MKQFILKDMSFKIERACRKQGTVTNTDHTLVRDCEVREDPDNFPGE